MRTTTTARLLLYVASCTLYATGLDAQEAPLTRVEAVALAREKAGRDGGDQVPLGELPDHIRLGELEGTAFGARRFGERILAAGRGYLATFEGGSLSFSSALETGATHEAPLVYRLSSVYRGDERIWEAAPGAEPSPFQLEQLTVERQVEPWLSEVYEVREDGLEQSFVLQSLPAGKGDLVVRGRVETELVCAASSEPRAELSFERPSSGGVGFRDVVGYDAIGQRVGGSMRYDGEFLDLTLPGEFVDRAVFPLVLDPIVYGMLHPTTSSSDSTPDIAWDADTDRFCVVWNRKLGSTSQVIARVFSGNGSALTSEIMIDWVWGPYSRPVIANMNEGNRFVIAYRNSWAAGNPQEIIVSTLSADTLAFHGGDRTYFASQYVPLHLDIGGDPIEPYSRACLVWTDNNGRVLGQMISIDSAGRPSPSGGLLSILDGGAAVGYVPRITNSNGAPGRWYVTWTGQTWSSYFGYYDWSVGVGLFGRGISYQGTLFPTVQALAHEQSLIAGEPAVAGDGDTLRVVYVGLPPFAWLTGGSGSVYGKKVSFDGATNDFTAAPPAQFEFICQTSTPNKWLYGSYEDVYRASLEYFGASTAGDVGSFLACAAERHGGQGFTSYVEVDKGFNYNLASGTPGNLHDDLGTMRTFARASADPFTWNRLGAIVYHAAGGSSPGITIRFTMPQM